MRTRRTRRKWRNLAVALIDQANGGGGGGSYYPTYRDPVTLPDYQDPIVRPSYQEPVASPAEILQSAFDSAMSDVSRILTPVATVESTYQPMDPVSWIPIEQRYIPPTPSYVPETSPTLIEPVSTPSVTYMDPAINAPSPPEGEGSSFFDSIIDFFSPEPQIQQSQVITPSSGAPAVTYTDPAMGSPAGAGAASGGGGGGGASSSAAAKKAAEAQPAAKSSSAWLLILVVAGAGALALLSKK
jgi:hypothetical protein